MLESTVMVSSPVARNGPVGSLALLGPGVRRRQRSVRSHLINKDQPFRLDLFSDHHPPGSSQELVSFQRPHRPFFWEKPSRFISRLTVESLISVPVMCSKKRRLSLTVVLGRSSTSFSRRARAFSSALRGRPGLFLGVRESPCRTLLAYRLTEERLTSKVRAASALDIPRSIAATIFLRRSSE